MIRSIFVFVILALVQAAAFAQSPFTLEQGKPKVIKPDDLAKIGHHAAAGTVNGSTITYTGKEISIVAVAGPEDDMFSYRIQGLKNPQLVVPAGAVLNVLVVNIDTDMTHDIRFGRVAGDFPAAPVLAGTAGSVKLAPRAADGSYHAQ